MSGKGWGKHFGKSSTKKKDKEHSDKDKHETPKNSRSSSKGGTHGSKKQPSGSSSSYDDPPVYMNPITVTTTATGTAKPKAEAPGGAKRVDPPSDKDLKYAIDSLVGDPQGRRDSKGDVEYYREQYRKLKGENESLRDKVEDLREEVESVQNRVRMKNQVIAETNDLMNQKDRELSKIQKAQEGSAEQLNAIQKRYTLLSQEKDQVEADKCTLEQSYKAKIADLEQKLSETSADLSHYNKEFLKAQEDDTTMSVMKEKMKELEKNLEKSNTALQEEKERVKRRDKQLAKLDTTAISYSTQLGIVKAELQEVKDSKQAECQQMEAHNVKQQEKIAQLENTVVNQTVKHSSAVEKITKEMTELKVEIEQMKTKLQEAEKEQQSLQETNDKKKEEMLQLQKTISGQTTKEEQMKAAIRESQTKHQQQVLREKKEKEDAIKQLQELQEEKNALEEQVKISQNKGKAELKILVEETKKRIEELKENHKAELNKMEVAMKEAVASKENLEQQQTQHHFEAKEKGEQIKNLQGQLEQKEEKIKTLEDNLRKQSNMLKSESTGQLEEVLKEKETLEQQMKAGYKEREDRIAELEEFINDQVTELDKMEAAMKQTVANKKIAEEELNAALEKKQGELEALKVACEKKDEEIEQLNQSLSQMPVDKEEMDQIRAKLTDTEEKLVQANRELQTHRGKEYSIPTSEGTTDDDDVSFKNLTKENLELTKKCSELNKEKESLAKRCEEFRKSCDMLKNMLQKNPGKEMQTELLTKNIEIDKLNQQIRQLQKETETIKSSTTEASSEHEAYHELQPSVEHQPQSGSDQSAKLHQKLQELEQELESTKLAMENEREKHEKEMKELETKLSNRQSMNQSIATEGHSQDVIEQRECEGHKQTCEQLYTGYQSLTKHFRHKDEEVDKLKSECSELQSVVEKQEAELREIKQELESVSNLSNFIQEQHEKLIMAEKDRDTATAMMLDHKELEEKTHTELNAKVTEMRNNYLLLMSQVQSKDAEIAKLTQVIKDVEIAESRKDLESKLAQVHVKPVRVDGNKETELFQYSSCETTPPSPSRSVLTISTAQPSPERLALKEKDQTIAQLREQLQEVQVQLMKSSGGTGSDDVCAEPTQTGGVGDSPNEGNCDTSDPNSMINQLSKQLEEEQQAKKDMEDRLTKATAEAQELLNTYETNVQKIRSEKIEIEKQMKHNKAQMLAGYKEREDRIAELEEFINDQVTELDKMEAAMKQTVANKQALEENHKDVLKSKAIMEKEFQQLNKLYEQTKDKLSDKDTQLNTVQQLMQKLMLEVDDLKAKNDHLSTEICRLIEVDQELVKAKAIIKNAEDELANKEIAIQTYREDFEAERKDRENAHNIKEEEIEKIRIEKEEWMANHDEDIKRVQENYQAQLNTYSRKVHELTTNNTKLSQENARLLAALEKQKKEVQNKADLYKNKTEQFQVQWRKREEAEKTLKDLNDQLSAQRRLNADQQNTIDDLLRKTKGIDNKIPTNVSDVTHKQQDQRRTSHEAAHHSMATSRDYPSSQHPSKYSASMGSKYPPQQHDATSGQTNADMSKYYYQQQHQQQQQQQSLHQQHQQQQQLHQQEQTWQQERQRQHQYQMNQQPQNNLHLREQGRGMFHNQPVRPGGDVYAGDSNYPQKYLPPTRDHLGGQPMSLGRVNVAQRDYGMAGTNAAPQHDTPRMDDTYHDRLNNPPMSLDSFRSKNPAPVSEGINEEIRIQADLQRRQQQEDEFESGLAYDPYLICHKCNRQFREGQLPEYRHHIDNCRH